MHLKRTKAILTLAFALIYFLSVGGSTSVSTQEQNSSQAETPSVTTRTTRAPLKTNESLGHLQALSTAISCPTGSFQTLSRAEFCAAGRTLDADGSQSSVKSCVLCEPGKYKDVVGNFPCFPCPAGTFSAAFGATCNLTCLGCPTHSTSFIDGSISCNCDAGFEFMAGPVALEIPSPANRAPWQESRYVECK